MPAFLALQWISTGLRCFLTQYSQHGPASPFLATLNIRGAELTSTSSFFHIFFPLVIISNLYIIATELNTASKPSSGRIERLPSSRVRMQDGLYVSMHLEGMVAQLHTYQMPNHNINKIIPTPPPSTLCQH